MRKGSKWAWASGHDGGVPQRVMEGELGNSQEEGEGMVGRISC